MMGAEEVTERLAWVVLRAANRAQAKGSTARLVVPRAPEVADEMSVVLTDEQLVSVEVYLEERGYIVPTDLDLIWDAFTITPAGLGWLERPLYDRGAAFDSALRAEVEEACRQLEDVGLGKKKRVSWRRMLFGA